MTVAKPLFQSLHFRNRIFLRLLSPCLLPLQPPDSTDFYGFSFLSILLMCDVSSGNTEATRDRWGNFRTSLKPNSIFLWVQFGTFKFPSISECSRVFMFAFPPVDPLQNSGQRAKRGHWGEEPAGAGHSKKGAGLVQWKVGNTIPLIVWSEIWLNHLVSD